MTDLLGNPYYAVLYQTKAELSYEATATLALAFEQHQRNRLAALTAYNRGLDLPEDLMALVEEE